MRNMLKWRLLILRRSVLSFVGLLFISTVDARAQVINGLISDSASDQPVADARVTVLIADSLLAATTTDSAGAFSLRVSYSGSVRVEVQRLGYTRLVTQPVLLQFGDTMRLELKLSPAPIALGAIAAATKATRNWNLEQFLERKRSGWGRYLGPDELAELPPTTPIQAVLRAGGGRFLTDDSGNGLLMRAISGGYCVPRVFIDGVIEPTPERRALPGNRRPVGLPVNTHVTAASIRGIEVYHRPTEAPVEYHSALQSACGIVLIWTDRAFGANRFDSDSSDLKLSGL